MNDTILEVLKFVFPMEVVDFFDITKAENISNTLHVYFEEKNNPPVNNLKSNGFYDESEIKDFPLRDKKVVLHLKRRRWIDDVGKSYSNEFQLVAIGTRYSKEFAEFLKKIARYEADFS
jgi:transposase